MSRATRGFTESVVKQATPPWLESIMYTILAGPETAPGEQRVERDDYGQAVLETRLREALERRNPKLRRRSMACSKSAGSWF
jgi:type I restriction enzyme R subunit